MIRGFKATLFASVIAFGAFAPVYAAAPVISGLPDIQVGDEEDSALLGTDSNFFRYSAPFSFRDYVSDGDTPVEQLKWSFGEFSNPAVSANNDNQYTINGVEAVNQGDAAIAADEVAGYTNAKNPGANEIDASGTETIFRDILFSPASGSAPFAAPSGADAAAAAAGKALRIYVADPEGNVGYQDILIKSVDNEYDVMTETDGYQEVVRVTDFDSGWVKSGEQSDGIVANNTGGSLDVVATPSAGRQRVHGWLNFDLLPYDQVGPTKFVRGKFFIHSSASSAAAVNTIPNFRLRVSNEGAVNASAHYEFVRTGQSDPGYEPFYGAVNNPELEAKTGPAFRPSSDAAVPSLYRVDFDPVDVPAAGGTSIGALFESFATSDPANSTLSLTEVALATYDVLLDEDPNAELIFKYNRTDGGLTNATNAGGVKELAGSGFNHDTDMSPGRMVDLDLPLGVNAPGFFHLNDEGANGVVGDSAEVSHDVFGIGFMDIKSVNHADKARVEPNALYRAKFYATSFVPLTSTDPGTETQAALRFRFQTGDSSISYLLDMIPQIAVEGNPLSPAELLVREVAPGLGSQNLETDAALDVSGEDGGWYSVIVPSPFDDGGIRQDNGDNFGPIAAEPGAGVDAPSAMDITVGMDFIQAAMNIQFNGGTYQLGRPSRGHVRLSAVEIYKYPSIDDGGYDFSGN